MPKMYTKYGVEITTDAAGRPTPDNPEKYIRSSKRQPSHFSGASMSRRDHEKEIESLQMGCCMQCDDYVSYLELEENEGLCCFCGMEKDKR